MCFNMILKFLQQLRNHRQIGTQLICSEIAWQLSKYSNTANYVDGMSTMNIKW
jgi:hypothetical protein